MEPEDHPSNIIDKKIESKLDQRFQPIHDELNEIKALLSNVRAVSDSTPKSYERGTV